MTHIINDNLSFPSKEVFDAFINGMSGFNESSMKLSDLFQGCPSLSHIDLSPFSDFTIPKSCEYQECIDDDIKICTSSGI